MTRAFYSIVYDIVFLIERKINYFILFYFILTKEGETHLMKGRLNCGGRDSSTVCRGERLVYGDGDWRIANGGRGVGDSPTEGETHLQHKRTLCMMAERKPSKVVRCFITLSYNL